MSTNIEKFDVILKRGALVATIFGFIVIAWQMIIARQAYEAQAWQVIIQQTGEINKIFIEHPDLYPYFYQKKRVQSDDIIYPKVISMADMYLDFIDGFEDAYVRKLAGMEDGGKYRIPWENYFQDQFSQSPALCNRYKEVKSWYTEDGVLETFAKKGCSKVE